jgi:hypothetical protein
MLNLIINFTRNVVTGRKILTYGGHVLDSLYLMETPTQNVHVDTAESWNCLRYMC